MVINLQLALLVGLISAVGIVNAWPAINKPAEVRVLQVEDIYFQCIKQKPEVILLDLNLNKLRDVQRMSKACNAKQMDLNRVRTVVALGDAY